jgi:hypothetical protein
VDRPAKVLRTASALAVFSFGAAASAGEIGPTSSATATISLTVAPHLDVRETTAAAGPAAGGGARTYRFCVSANTPTRLYGVTLAASAEGDSSPDVASPLLEWAGESDVSNGRRIGTGEPETGFVAADGSCGGRSNAALIVTTPAGHPVAQSFSQTLLIVPE